MQTLGAYLLRCLVPSLAVGCCQRQPYSPALQRTTSSSRFFSLSLSALPDCSAMRKYLVLAPAEAGGIRCTVPPTKEKVWVSARNNKRTNKVKINHVYCHSGYYCKRLTRAACRRHVSITGGAPAHAISTCALGRAHIHAKADRADVGRSPRTIDSRARVS